MIKQVEFLTNKGWVKGKSISVGDVVISLNQQGKVCYSTVSEIYHSVPQSEQIIKLSNIATGNFIITSDTGSVVAWNRLGDVVCRFPFYRFLEVNEQQGYSLITSIKPFNEGEFKDSDKKYIDQCIRQKRVEPNISRMNKKSIDYFIEQWIDKNSKHSLDRHLLCKDYKDASTMQQILINGGYLSRINRADGFEVIKIKDDQLNLFDRQSKEICGESLYELIDSDGETINVIVRINDQTIVM